MPPLPAIRETPIQVSAEIRNRGSFTIPDEARKSHRVLIDIEVESVTRQQYGNFNYNLPQGDYCNVTYWAGASICDTRKVKYVSERLLDWVNTEASIINAIANAGYVIVIDLISFAATVGSVLVPTPYVRPSTWGLNISHLKFVCPPDTQIRVTCQWYPFVEFEGAPMADPDLDDPASGEPEYPEPRQNPFDDPWRDNPAASGPDPLRDPRDFSPDNDPPPPVDPEAGNVNTWKIHVSSPYFTGDGYFTCRGTPSIDRGSDGRVVDATGGDPNQPASSGQTITSRIFGGIDASSTVEVTKV